MGKDKVVLRSDIDPLHNPDPFVKHPEQVRNHFKQYGDLEIIYNSHTTRGGLEKYVVVMQFKQPAAANKVKQKYNGRVLMDARVTTSWLDERQVRDLGISALMLENKRRQKEMRIEGRKGGEKSSLSASDKDSVIPRSQPSPHSGMDTESVSSIASLYLPEPRAQEVDTSKSQTVKLLEQSPASIPFSSPKAATQMRDRTPTKRHDSIERPDSRASHSSRERESSPRYSTRKRQHKDEEEQETRSSELRQKLPSLEIYVPRMKRLKQESMSDDTTSVFDRLEPTQEDSFQAETFGELPPKKVPEAAEEKVSLGETSGRSSVSLGETSGRSSVSLRETSGRSSVSSDSKVAGSELKSTTSETTSEHSSRKSSERDGKHSTEKRRSSEREGKHSDKKGKHKHKKSRKSSEKSGKEKKSSKKSRRSSKHKTKEGSHSAEREIVGEKDPPKMAEPNTIEPDSTPPIDHQYIDPANPQESSVEQWTAWLEYYQQMGYQPEEIVQYIEAAASAAPLDSSEGSQIHEVVIPLTSQAESVSGTSRRHRQDKPSKVDKNLQASILQEFDSQSFVLATATKLLVSKSPHHKEAVTRSLEAALWQIACNLLTKFRDRINN